MDWAAGEDADPGQGRGQDDHEDAQAVDADLVLDAEGRDPVERFLVLEAGLARGERNEQRQRQSPHHQGGAECRTANQVGPARWHDRDQKRTDQGQERY